MSDRQEFLRLFFLQHYHHEYDILVFINQAELIANAIYGERK